jgi:hypothetical protein
VSGLIAFKEPLPVKENIMKNGYLTLLFSGLCLLNIFAPVFQAEQQKVEKLAQEAAEPWLALVDASKYLQSWNAAASFFKQQVKSEQWESAVKSVREPLGKLESRKLTRAQYTRTIPGAPDGEYVILQFETSFAKKKLAIETVTPMKDQDGQWRVAGYFIK